VGTIIDPLADKTLMTVLTVTLAMQGSLPGEFLSLHFLASVTDRIHASKSG